MDYENLLERIEEIFESVRNPISCLTERECDILAEAVSSHPMRDRLLDLIVLCSGGSI